MIIKRLKHRVAAFAAATALVGVAACGGGLDTASSTRVQSLGSSRAAQFAERVLERAFDKLDARPEQKVAVRALTRKLLAAHARMKAVREASRAVLEAQWAKARMNPEVVAAERVKLEHAMLAFSRAIADGIVELHGILDATQRTQVAQQIERLRDLRRRFRRHAW